MNYTDIEHKLNYHKQLIIQKFISQGIYPDNSLINSRLNSIELRLAIFKSPVIKTGDAFNTEEFNNAITAIYNDLKILYQILYIVTVKEYNKLSYYIDTHIRDLNETATMYLKRAQLENYSTALGKSIYYAYNNFDVSNASNKTVIHLGNIEIEDASKIACIADIKDTDLNNIVFRLVKGNTTLSCNTYNYNHDTISLPGTKTQVTHEVSALKSQTINDRYEIPLAVDNIDTSSFITLAGKDKIMYKLADESGDIINERPIAINSLSFPKHSYIDFYVIGGSSISFRFNKAPISTNFNTDTGAIENLDYIHHFFIECDDNFSFDFNLEKGTIYAYKEKTLVQQDALYYSGKNDVTDFLIVQTLESPCTTYDVYVDVLNSSINAADINSVMIKKIS